MIHASFHFRRLAIVAGAALAVAFVQPVNAQTKKELVQRVLQAQQQEIELVARNITERPAAEMMREAGLAIQSAVAPDKREATGRAVEAEVKKYVDESVPLVRERALKLAPTTIGPILEQKMSDDELKALLAWLDSPVNKKYQSLAPEMRNAFVQQLLAESRSVLEPRLQALDGRLRVVLGVPPINAGQASAAAGGGPRPPAPGAASRPSPNAATRPATRPASASK